MFICTSKMWNRRTKSFHLGSCFFNCASSTRWNIDNHSHQGNFTCEPGWSDYHYENGKRLDIWTDLLPVFDLCNHFCHVSEKVFCTDLVLKTSHLIDDHNKLYRSNSSNHNVCGRTIIISKSSFFSSQSQWCHFFSRYQINDKARWRFVKTKIAGPIY